MSNVNYLFAFLCLLLIGCGPQASLSDSKVIGGTVLGPSDFPEAIRLYSNACTAVKIGEHSILTAAHCVTISADTRVGVSDKIKSDFAENTPIKILMPQMNDGRPFSVTIKKTVIHPAYSLMVEELNQLDREKAELTEADILLPHNKYLDLAIVETIDPLPGTTAHIQKETVAPGNSITIVGVGCTSFDEGPFGDKLLRKAELTVSKIQTAHIAATVTGGDEQRGGCPGDSGGGAFLVDENGDRTLIGINAHIDFENWETFEGLTTYVNRLDSAVGAYEWITQQINP